ncbi:MAG: hypothetical protein A2X12_11900 [Bacteroidetes bacterium GWE2_29_8]|nr:MAG: hypothetical protein A2X12_11900 [Bacteroidetes bacterium GWE2_29_8]OFY22162.1 MAG: hypothetical protein A2X02_00365 [Bacteroidetes bacterium GWF2_29_10]
MAGKTFAEKIFGATRGSILFKKPDIVMSHDNSSSIYGTFKKMNGEKIKFPEQVFIVLDHNAPPTNSKLANDYQKIREIVKENNITKFHDSGKGICHQLMSLYAKPEMIIVGSDSHTCTAGAFNAFAAGIDRTETAGLWKKGETWFKVPESIKITLKGKFQKNVYAKDLALWIIGMIGSSGADYMSIEYHGEGVGELSISDRMTLANLASEMGAKNAVFPNDKILKEFLKQEYKGIWADDDAIYAKEVTINLGEIVSVVSCPHHVDNVKSVAEVQGIVLHQAVLGTCTNGRIEDLRIAAEILKGKQIPYGLQLLIIPASQEIYRQAMNEGLIEIFLNVGANILSPSCGPCLGTGQGIPADNTNVISTANRNFLGRMGNKNANIYLSSPATLAYSVLEGKITSPMIDENYKYPYHAEQSKTLEVTLGDDRFVNNVWDYSDVDNLNTDQMFAGNLTYNVNSSEAEKIIPHLFKGFDDSFSDKAKEGDMIIAGENFGCGSSREHPAVGLAHIGIKAVICKSVNRIFYRSSINQGLLIIVLPEVVDAYRRGANINVDFSKGEIIIDNKAYYFKSLPEKLLEVINQKGLVNWMKNN